MRIFAKIKVKAVPDSEDFRQKGGKDTEPDEGLFLNYCFKLEGAFVFWSFPLPGRRQQLTFDVNIRAIASVTNIFLRKYIFSNSSFL